MEQESIQVEDYDSWKERTLYEQIGCGNLFGIFQYENNCFDRVTLKCDMSKETSCGDSWLGAMGGILTFALRRALVEDELVEGTQALKRGIIGQLKSHKCNKRLPGKAMSCADAIARMLVKFMEIEHAREKKEKIEATTNPTNVKL